MIVSHDFRLISQVAEQLWEVKDKKIRVRFQSLSPYLTVPLTLLFFRFRRIFLRYAKLFRASIFKGQF